MQIEDFLHIQVAPYFLDGQSFLYNFKNGFVISVFSNIINHNYFNKSYMHSNCLNLTQFISNNPTYKLLFLKNDGSVDYDKNAILKNVMQILDITQYRLYDKTYDQLYWLDILKILNYFKY